MSGLPTGTWEPCPVRWLNQHAYVVMPERFDQGHAEPVRDQLLAVLDHEVRVLIVDMTATLTCDHHGGEALARVYQRAVARGTELRLVAGEQPVRRVLAVTGLDRLVPVSATLAAALASTPPARGAPPETVLPRTGPGAASPGPAGVRATGDRAGPGGPARAGDVGVEVALLDRNGVIVWVNQAWQAFAAANGGDPARTGRGMSYLEVCAAAADDPVTGQVAAAIRDALAGELPAPLTVEVACHSPRVARWFDVLISARRDDEGRVEGAAVTLSLARTQPQPSPPDPAPGRSG